MCKKRFPMYFFEGGDLKFIISHLHTSTCCTTSDQFQNFYLHHFTNVCKIFTKNSSNFWNSLSPTASSASIKNSINNYREWPWVHSLIISNIYMEHPESLAIPTSPTLIKWPFRYVDVHSATRKIISANFKSTSTP